MQACVIDVATCIDSLDDLKSRVDERIAVEMQKHDVAQSKLKYTFKIVAVNEDTQNTQAYQAVGRL